LILAAWITGLLLSLGCDPAAPSSPNGEGTVDAGAVAPDAGNAPTDAGASADAGSLIDAGPFDDAGSTLDAGMPAADGGADLVVATFNLLSGVSGGQPQERLDLAAALLQGFNPDLVALQEATNDPLNGNLAEDLADQLAMDVLWEPTHEVLVYEEGPALLSRWPIDAPEAVALPHGDLGGLTQRAVAGATLNTPFGPIRIGAAHMTISPEEDVKADQAKAAHDFVVGGLDGGIPGFLAGDLNATPDTLAMQFLRGEASHDGALGIFADAWTTAQPGENGFTIPSDGPDRRIDYIYFTPNRGIHPTGCVVFGDVPTDGLYPSDHLGVVCSFSSP
jgi:endonuclease/exonuclease/phosphatase family metal-dependent hydrolase